MSNSENMLEAIQRQDLKQASQFFKRALKEDASEILLALAAYLESIGFLSEAKEIYLQEYPHYPELAINLAQIMAEDGDVEKAFMYLDTISQESDYYISALLVMADLYDVEGLTEVAREKLLLANERSDDPLVIFGLAEIELKLGHFKQAIHEYAKLDNREILKSTGVSTYQRIGCAYASLGKFEVAIEFLEKAIEIDYSDDTNFQLATILYEQGEYQRAIVLLKQLDLVNPNFEGYEFLYAKSLHKEHNIEEALRVTQKGLSKNAFDVQLLLLASRLSYELQDFKATERYLLKAKEVAVDDEEIVMRLTHLYLEEKRYDEVVALSHDNIDNVLTKWNIAKAYRKLESDTSAFQLYNDISRDLNNNPEFLQDYAYFLHEYGEKEQAYELAKRYLQFVPDDMNMVDFLNENEF